MGAGSSRSSKIHPVDRDILERTFTAAVFTARDLLQELEGIAPIPKRGPLRREIEVKIVGTLVGFWSGNEDARLKCKRWKPLVDQWIEDLPRRSRAGEE